MGPIGWIRQLRCQLAIPMDAEGATVSSERRRRKSGIPSSWFLLLSVIAWANVGVECNDLNGNGGQLSESYVPFKGYKGDLTPLHKLYIPIGPCKLLLWEPCGGSDDVMFHLYTSHRGGREFQTKILRYPVTKDMIEDSGYDPSLPTKVIIHGYGGGYTQDFITQALRDAYIQFGDDANIINMDWGKLSKAPCYPSAVINTLQGGHCLAQFLESLADITGLDLKNVHAIGLSLGAHLAAFASNDLSNEKKLGRITGLDPALPFFASLRRSWKLDAGDAHFVDVIHTNAGVFGKIEATGHVDFFVNGGRYQPACAEANNVHLCSHVLSAYYFAESINKKSVGFYGLSCPSYFLYIVGFCTPILDPMVKMGEYCSLSSRGVYMVLTGPAPPFAIGRQLTLREESKTLTKQTRKRTSKESRNAKKTPLSRKSTSLTQTGMAGNQTADDVVTL